MGLVKIRKKYRFDFCVLNIEEDISYTNIPQIDTGLLIFFIISKIFHGKMVTKALKSYTTRLRLPWSTFGGWIP